MAEAYDSDSGSESPSSSVSPSAIKTSAKVNGAVEVEDEDEIVRDEVEELDWDGVMGKLRSSVVDRSKKRRTAFINRYLTVSETCRSKGRKVMMSLLMV